MVVVQAICLSVGSPPLALDALVAAGVVPPLVALLGRWERIKAALAAGGPPRHCGHLNPKASCWLDYVTVVVQLVAALARRSPAARRQLRDAGAAAVLRALAADPEVRPSALLRRCCDALRWLQ